MSKRFSSVSSVVFYPDCRKVFIRTPILAYSDVGRNPCGFDNSGYLTQLANDLSQAGFVTVGVFLVDQVIPGGLIKKRGHLAVFFGCLFFIGLAA